MNKVNIWMSQKRDTYAHSNLLNIGFKHVADNRYSHPVYSDDVEFLYMGVHPVITADNNMLCEGSITDGNILRPIVEHAQQLRRSENNE